MKDGIYTLAHEIRNPLSVARGYLEMMNKSNLEKYKEIIKEEIDTSLEILNNYLDYNKIQLVKEEIDLNVLLMDIKNSMQDFLKKKGITFKIEFQDKDIYLEADYNRLKQVFYNIIKNSIEAQSKSIFIQYKVLFDQVEISICDDGLKCMEINKIGNNYSNKVLGNGIGLTLSKKIIEMHQGSIKFMNNKKGFVVKISLSLK